VDAIRGNVNSPYKPQFVWVEEKSTGKGAIDQLQREGIRIHGVQAYGQRGSPKLQVVINQTKNILASGSVHFPEDRFAMLHNMEWVTMAKAALLMYPRGQHDDIARAFIQLVFEAKRHQMDMGIIDVVAQSPTWGTTEGARARV